MNNLNMDPLLAGIVRNSAYMATGLALLLREGISPNQAVTAISHAATTMGGNDGQLMAEFLKEHILPNVVRATTDADEMLVELRKMKGKQ